ELTRRVEEHSKRLEEHSKRLEELTRRVEEISKRVEEHSKRLEEHSKRLEELTRRVEEISKRVEEHSKRLEELTRRVEEHSKRLEEHSKRLEELTRRVEEISKRVEEHSKRLEELTRRVEELTLTVANLAKAVVEVKIAVGSFTGRVGLDLEKTVFNLYRDVLLTLGIRDIEKVDRFIYRDVDGRYIGKGGRIEVDIYIHNNNTYLIEVKSLAQEEDVDWINKKFEIVTQILNRTPTRKIIIAVNITRDALKRAHELNIDVIYGAVID
ncbi:MAG: hypothetical protein QW646_03105, partial [Ignisphaera sp.]